MLLPLLLNLGFEADKVTIPPPPPTPIIGGGTIYHQQELIREKSKKEVRERIQIEDSEIIEIVKITLKHFII